MNTFKKIYTAIMILTVACLVGGALALLGVINLTSDTGIVIAKIIVTVAPLTLLFSKAANVIANRTNVNLGYGITFALLLYLLFFVLKITINFDVPTIVELILYIILAYMVLLTLIFEVPQANTAHKKYQKILTVIGTISFIIFILFLHTIELDIIKDYQNEQIKEAIRELAFPIQVAFAATSGITLIGIIINPMMRVYHIDNDFVAVGELDSALTRTTRYQTNTNPNPQAILSDKYKKDVKKEDKILNYLNKEQIVQELPDEVVTELPKEKVINQNFKETEITQTELPEITNNQNETIAPPPELVISTTPQQQETTTQPETTETTQENIDTTNIIEMAKAVADEAVTSANQTAETTQENIDTTNIVEMAKAVADEAVTSVNQTAETTQENIDTTNIVEMAKAVADEAVTSANQTAETAPQPTNNLEEQINKIPVQ